jgi:hypothetical protein
MESSWKTWTASPLSSPTATSGTAITATKIYLIPPPKRALMDTSLHSPSGCRHSSESRQTAEQLTQKERWELILSAAFRHFLGGKVIGSTVRLADATG